MMGLIQQHSHLAFIYIEVQKVIFHCPAMKLAIFFDELRSKNVSVLVITMPWL